MQFAPVNPPLIGCIHDGVVIPVRQRPVDGHFPVGPELHDQQPSRNGQQHRSTGPVHGVPALPGDQQPIAMFHGLASIGPGPAQAASYGNVHPGGPCHHAPSPGQPMLSLDQMMLRCSSMMDLLVQQQQHLQQALSTMAAAPFSSLRSMCEVPQLHKSEVTVAAHCSLAPCQPARSTTPQSSIKMCPVSSVPTENDRSPLWAHTIDTSTSLASPAQPTRDLEAAEHTPQPAGGHLSDVIGDDHDRRKLVQDPKQLPQVDSSGQRFLPEPANPNNHLITEAPPSTTAQNDISADVIDRELPFICSTLYAASDAAPKDVGRHKQINIIPIDYTSWPSSTVHGKTGVTKASRGLIHFTLWQFLSSPSKAVASAHGSLQLHIGTRGLRPKEGNPVSFLEQVPPWPPPLCTSSSPKHASNIFRGGRNNKMSILVAVTNPATCHTCPTQNFHKLHVQVTIGRFGRSAVCTFQLLSAHNDRHNVMVCNPKSRAKQLAVSSNHSVPHNQIMNQELICITVLVLDLDVHLYVTVDGQTTLDGRRK